jgi:hypothetical protein
LGSSDAEAMLPSERRVSPLGPMRSIRISSSSSGTAMSVSTTTSTSGNGGSRSRPSQAAIITLATMTSEGASVTPRPIRTARAY